MANVEIIHKNAGHIALAAHHTEQVDFVIDSTEINLNNTIDVEVRIYLDNPNTESRDLLIYMNVGSDPTPFTGRQITEGKHKITLISSNFPNTPYENYLVDYLKENGKLSVLIDLQQSTEEIYFLGMDMKITLAGCTGWRRWVCSFLCRSC